MDDPMQANRFAPPRTLVEDVATTDGPQVATRGSRLGAALIDGLFGLSLSLAIMLPMYGTDYFKMAAANKLSVLNGMLLYLGLFYAVEGWFLYQRSQSLGKMALGLRIVRPDGRPASFGRIFGLRLFGFGLLGWIPFVGPFIGLADYLFIFRTSRRCLHDELADTIVVTAASSTNAARTATRPLAA
jgi:uncharacterized RDD family membrane protein YckC